MIHEDNLAGVLDWEEARLDWLSWDLANALGTFCFAGDRLDREAARDLLAAYATPGARRHRQSRTCCWDSCASSARSTC
jgi:hypothetical protein